MSNERKNVVDSGSITFEQTFENLQKSVEQLEKGDLSLKDATDLYKKGMELVALCNDILTKTELKISEIKNTYSQQDSPSGNQEE
ncbi:MAG: exodeoxyribonuclease VII small subunit [Dehalococcoidia bacterium]|nr:exodeoxyribonuclease VII small subunit [SAR202 cluster bacterium]|tara:strand:- start:635 stop:889 length:255 start_codon:yes stop_codon:yes gene_type:complete